MSSISTIIDKIIYNFQIIPIEEMPLEYINLMLHTSLYMYTEKKSQSLLFTLFKMTKQTNICHSTIFLQEMLEKNITITLYTATMKKQFELFDKNIINYVCHQTKYTQSFKLLADDIIQLTHKNKYTCFNLCLVDVNNNGHSNILLTYKNNDFTISLIIFDPHGSNSDTSFVKLSNKFLKNLAKTSPFIFKMVDRNIISCPIGIQIMSNDSIGLCQLFSYFWLYFVLEISNVFQLLPTDLYKIEQHLLHLSFNQLKDILLKFGLTLIITHMNSCTNKIPNFLHTLFTYTKKILIEYKKMNYPSFHLKI